MVGFLGFGFQYRTFDDVQQVEVPLTVRSAKVGNSKGVYLVVLSLYGIVIEEIVFFATENRER